MKGLRRLGTAPAQQLQSIALRYRLASSPGRRELTDLTLPVSNGTRDAVDPPPKAPSTTQGFQRLEAILFLAREPLHSRKLSQLANLADGTEARTLIRRLNEKYDQWGRAFRVEEVAGGFQLLSRPKFASWIRRLEHVPGETRLSAPAMETLAVVAYRQPVLRADIEAIRGVSCGEILRQLMERDLVRISGRSEELGRPFLYSTTRRFLETFGLQSLDHLPRVESLRPDPTLDENVDPTAGETEPLEEAGHTDARDSDNTAQSESSDPSYSQTTDSNDRPMEEADVSVTAVDVATNSISDEAQAGGATPLPQVDPPTTVDGSQSPDTSQALDDDEDEEEWEYGDYYDDDEDDDDYDEDEDDDEADDVESDEDEELDDDEEDDDYEDDYDEDDDDDEEDDDDDFDEDDEWEEVDDEDDDDWDEEDVDDDDDWGDDDDEEEDDDEEW